MGGGPELFAKYCMQAAVCKCVSCIGKQCHALPQHPFVLMTCTRLHASDLSVSVATQSCSILRCIDAQLSWRHTIRTAELVACTVCCQAMGCHSIFILLVYNQICLAGCSKHSLPRHRQWQTTLPAGCAWPGHPTAGSGWRPETPAGDLDHTHTPAPASHRKRACVYKKIQSEDICDLTEACSRQRLAAAHHTFRGVMTAVLMRELSLHDNTQACKHVQPGLEDTIAAPMLHHWVAVHC